MEDWNVVVTVRQGAFVKACDLLEAFGTVRRTDFLNVLVMKVRDVEHFLAALREEICEDPVLLTCIARVMPVEESFSFHSVEEFEHKAREAVLKYVPRLGGKRFHLRMHRRGFKGRLSSHTEERYLGDALLEALERAATPGSISFDAPDAILAIETVGSRGGVSLWRREDLERFPFLCLE